MLEAIVGSFRIYNENLLVPSMRYSLNRLIMNCLGKTDFQMFFFSPSMATD